MTTLTFQPFDKAASMAFAGAENFHDGSSPIIAATEDWTFAICGDISDERAPHPVRCEIFKNDMTTAFQATFDTKAMAILVCSSLTAEHLTPAGLQALGFFQTF